MEEKFYYMIWYQKQIKGRKIYFKNTIGLPCCFQNVENVKAVFNDLCKKYPIVCWLKINDKTQEEVVVRIKEDKE